MEQTSREAFESIRNELSKRQEEVFMALKILEVANNRMIANYMNKPINTIVPRIFELRKLKLVGVAKTDIDTITKRKTIFWKCVK
jgi:hypothetical protein